MKRDRIFLWLATAALIAGMSGFYYWTAASDFPGTPVVGGARADYYNRLVRGFRDGRLAMDVTPEPRVEGTTVEPFLLDASFYRGKYYLYFGVTPALTLFLPWDVLTGNDLPEWAAGAFLAATALLVAAAWLGLLRREFFARGGRGVWLAVVVAWGLGSGLPVVLRRTLFYEVAIVSGLLWTTASLLCLTLAAVRPGRSRRWLALAGACAGLAAGSRPTLIPGALVALALMAGWCWRRGDGGADGAGRRALRVFAAPLAPAGACLVALAWYNWARFGNPFEFGLNYQVGSHGDGFPFTLAAFWANLRLYYFTAPDVGWYFPFFAPGPKPPGSYFEQVNGQFYCLALFALAIGAAAWGAWRRRLSGNLVAVVATAGVWAGASLVVDAMAPVHSNRYQLDFHPVLLALALLAVFACAAGGRGRWLARVAVAWLGVVAFYNFGISFQVHNFFLVSNPQAYAAVARVCDRLVWPLYRLTRPALSGIRLSVVFRAAPPGTLEPLVVAGAGPDVDAIMVRYTGPDRAQLLFDHQGFGTFTGPEFDLEPGRERRLDLRLGTICPPPWHPWYDAQPPGTARQRTRVAAWLDDQLMFDRDAPTFQASSSQLLVGHRGQLLYGTERFSGSVRLVGPLPPDAAWLDRLAQAGGPVRLRLRLPRDRFGATDPLLLTGEPGRADLVSVRYLREGFIQLVMTHENGEERVSPPLAVDYGQPHELVMESGALRPAVALPVHPAMREAYVALDGRTVLHEPFRTYPAAWWEVWVGCLPWQLEPCQRLFGGPILAGVRGTSADAGRAVAALAAGRQVALTVLFPRGAPDASEPLLTSGVTGRGDGLYVHYMGNDAVRFGFDHWSRGGPVSLPVPVDFGSEHHLVLSWGALRPPDDPARRTVRLALDGRVVLDAPVEYYPALPSQVALGRNPIGMSTSQPAFTGDILAVVPAASDPGPALTSP